MPECTYGFVDRLSRYVQPPIGKKVFFMLEAYVDESGTHGDARTCVIAGYWGGENRWRSFDDRWSRIIQEADEPTMKEFHSVEFWRPDGTRKGLFARWSDAKAERFIDDLLDCISDHDIYPTTATLKVEAWKKLTRNERRFLTGGMFNPVDRIWITPSAPNKTYYLPFQFVVMAPGLACKDGLKVHYVFDIHKQFKNHASDLFALLKKDHKLSCRHKLGEFSMADGVDAEGLQAADLLAYQAYQYNKKTLDPAPISKLPYILRRALARASKGDSNNFPFFNEQGLETALADLPEEIRKSTLEYPIKVLTSAL